jgi:SIR2-like domain
MLRGDAVVLLGAGASSDAGVPTSRTMTQEIVKTIASSRVHAHTAAALNYVCAALMAYDAQEGANPFDGIDVERVFAALQLLQERQHDLEISPFVASWQPAVDGLDPPQRGSLGVFDKGLKEALDRRFPASRGEGLIRELIRTETRGGSGATYAALADLMLRELRRQIQIKEKSVGYLVPLVEHGRRPQGLTIATLNYDRTIELACETAGVRCSTGIERWIKGKGWAWPRKGVRLLKLHGSIDWAWEQERRPLALPQNKIVVTDDQDKPPALIFGRRAKLQAKGPFLALLAEFERRLGRSSQLVVIGYSFRDDHVNEVLRRWTGDDQRRTILVVDPSWKAEPGLPSGVTKDFRLEMEEHLMQADSPRLQIWSMRCVDAVRRLSEPLSVMAQEP